MSWASMLCIFFTVFTFNSYWNGGLGSTFGKLDIFWPEVPNSSSFFPEANPTASGNHVGQVYPSDRPTLQYRLSALILSMCLWHLPEKQLGMQFHLTVPHGREMWGAMGSSKTGTQLAIFILFGPEVEATASLFYFQLNLSGSTFRDLPRSVFPWQL